jgi:hypothetical protein
MAQLIPTPQPVKPGRENVLRAYAETIEKAIGDMPDPLATLKLHYLRWVPPLLAHHFFRSW